jgi:hypothetical protein
MSSVRVLMRRAQGREATAYGLFTAVVEAALAVGGLGLGLGLGVLDYRGGESDRLLLLMIDLPALGAIGWAATCYAEPPIHDFPNDSTRWITSRGSDQTRVATVKIHGGKSRSSYRE